MLMKLGSPAQLTPGERQRRIPAVFILVACLLTMVVFVPYHFYSANHLIALLDIMILLFSIIALIHLNRTKRGLTVYWMISLVFFILCIGTVVLGRIEISYFLWAFVPPAIVFSILGKKTGLVMSLIFFTIALFLMTASEQIMPSKPYSVYIVGRYITIYLLLTFILYYYESSQQMLLAHIKDEKEKFEYASKRDPLTGLFNRRELLENMHIEQQRQMRMKNSFTLIMCDIDDFKTLNETHGHDAGDYILKKIGELLKEQVRGIDCPARWGGEEFLIMLIETDLESGKTVAERIRKKIETADFTFDGTALPVTMTFGLSEYQGANDTLDSCIKRTDKALHIGKHQGKNKVIVG